MNREIILETLRRHREELRERFGVERLALFGSTARGEASGSSDVDLLVEYDRPITLFDLAATMMRLEEILGVAKVDLVLRDSLLEELRGPILAEAVDV